ncbi:MAG: leucine-rich repeat protein [Bacteroidales bacterium]|nr:leucine-rich repeat protein [Bacteroidales bacterium]
MGISEDAFNGCNSIKGICISKNISRIGRHAFLGCTSLDSVIYNAVNCQSKWFHGDGAMGYVNESPGRIHKVVVGDNVQVIPPFFMNQRSALNTIVIGRNVKKVCEYAFYKCTNVSDATILSEDIRYIGDSSFCLCGINSTINLNNAISIGAHAFHNYGGTIIMSAIESTIKIGKYAFANCDNILSVSTNARSIGEGAFSGCDRLVEVSLGDSVQTIGDEAFKDCYRLKNVSWGDGITSIGDKAFMGCTRLLRSELPQSLTTIGSHAFDGCVDLGGRLTFPDGITTIGDYAYANNGTVSEIEMLGSTPPTIFAHTFSAVDSMVTVSVPCGAVLSYYTTTHWENFPNIVEAPPYRLAATSNNAVMGTAAVTQQPTCTDHTARLQATANSGYHFLQWNDGNTANPRQIAMTQDTSFEAIFAVNYSYITVSCNDSTMGAASGTGLYNYNASVTLSATAYNGYHFLKWSDGNTQNPRYLAAIRDSLFTAVFVSNVSSITVANANPEMGNVGGSGVYYYMNQVSLTATANYGYHFTQWNDGSTLNPRTITVSQDSTFTAYFGVNSYSIVATPSNTTMGSVSGGGSYNYLHEMSMMATPAYGYHFVKWQDDVTDNPRTITVTRDSMFTAQFAANSYAITAEPNDPTMGSTYGSGTYTYGSTATLMAVETYGYHFTQWSDGTTDNPRQLTVQSALTLTAQFEINTYILTVQSSNPAIGTTSGGGSYSYLTPVNIEALPNAGYRFTQWSDGNTDNPRLVSITQNATYTAQFAINSYALAVQSNNSNMGAVSGSGTYNHNAAATLAATPYYGYHFVQWQDGNTDNPRTVVVTDSARYTAQFEANSYLIVTNSSNVTIGTAMGGGSYPYLQQVALTAVAEEHYHFAMWNDSVTDNPRTITVTRDTLFTAFFVIDTHAVTVASADTAMGHVYGTGILPYGSRTTVSATAKYGYLFAGWNDGNMSNPRQITVVQDTSLLAMWDVNHYRVVCNSSDTTRGIVANEGGIYGYLTPVTFQAVPLTGWHFLRWNNGEVQNPITFNVQQDTLLTAIFVGLTVECDSSRGSVSHTKTSNLNETLLATPFYGYHFVRWGDGNTDNPRAVTLQQDTLFAAQFELNQYLITVEPNDTLLGSVSGGGLYQYQQQATLTATPREHCHFVQWDDGNTANPRPVVTLADERYEAIFTRDARYNIDVVANDTIRGAVLGGGVYWAGEQYTLVATPREHYYFYQWDDGGSSNPRTDVAIADMTYTALFEPEQYDVTVEANDYSMGQVAGSGSYDYGSVANIVAHPFDDYRFVQWQDGDTTQVRQVTVISTLRFVATFERKEAVGIDMVEADRISISVQNGQIIVRGAEHFTLYDVSGRQWPTDAILPRGVYLIYVGHKAHKVVVE